MSLFVTFTNIQVIYSCLTALFITKVFELLVDLQCQKEN